MGIPDKATPPPRECPKCEIISPPGTEICECGYVFSAERDTTVYKKQSWRMLVVGTVLSILSLGFALAQITGGTGRRLPWIAFMAGLAMFLGGLKRLMRKSH